MLRTLALSLMLFSGFALAVPEVPVYSALFGVEEAHAQQSKRRRKTLFDILFNRKKSAPRRNSERNRVNRRNLSNLPGVNTTPNAGSTTTNRRASSTAPAPAKPQVIKVKEDDAAKILVVGDFMGSGVAYGLERLYLDNANFRIVSETQANSGIVRDDVVDWAERVPELLEEVKPIAMVALIGMNDRQQMRLSTGRVEKLSDKWLEEYNRRVEKIASAGIQRNVPVVWVGLPPVRSGNMNSDYLVFNEIYRTKAEAVGAVFVDVWDGFTNEKGKFVSAGPDINGQIVRLRGSKGINMTRAGKTKLGFFADKALKKLGIVNSADGAQFVSLGNFNAGTSQPQIPTYDPVGTGKTVVIPLGSPMSDGGNELEGDEDFLKPEAREASVSYDLVEKGLGYLPKDGRIDAGWGAPAPDEKLSDNQNENDEADTKPENKNPDEVSNAATPQKLPKVTNIQPAN